MIRSCGIPPSPSQVAVPCLLHIVSHGFQKEKEGVCFIRFLHLLYPSLASSRSPLLKKSARSTPTGCPLMLLSPLSSWHSGLFLGRSVCSPSHSFFAGLLTDLSLPASSPTGQDWRLAVGDYRFSGPTPFCSGPTIHKAF